MNDWLETLRSACAASSQSAIARQLKQSDGYPSAALLNQVLKGSYRGRTDRLQAIVEGELMGQTVVCPVLGSISRSDCEAHQTRKFGYTNPQRVRLYRACRSGCPNSKLTREYS